MRARPRGSSWSPGRAIERLVRVGACAAAVCALLALAAVPASAHLVEHLVFDKSITGADAVGAGSSPAFDSIGKLDIDQASNSLIVGTAEGGGRLYKIDLATGASSAFSGLAGSTVIHLNEERFEYPTDLAVDNSGTATQGRIFVFEEFGQFRTYLASGLEDHSFPFPKFSPGDLCGAAMGADGKSLWLSFYEVGIKEYDPVTAAATGKNLNGSSNEACDFEIDGSGNFYVPINWQGGVVKKYSPSGQFQYNLGTANSISVAVDRSTENVYVNHGSYVLAYTSSGSLLDKFGEPDPPYGGFFGPAGIVVDKDTHNVYVASGNRVDVFTPGPPIVAPDTTTNAAIPNEDTATLLGVLNPDGVETTDCYFEWGTSESYGNKVDCAEGDSFTGSADQPVSAAINGGLIKGTTYHVRLVASNTNGMTSLGADRTFVAQGPASVVDQYVNTVLNDGARLQARIDPNFGVTAYHFEYGTTEGYGSIIPVPDASLASTTGVQLVAQTIHDLEAGTEYHYRVAAINAAGTTYGSDRTFSTFDVADAPVRVDDCPNALARQQTGAIDVPDCRAYELASAAETGGYSVESDLVPGQTPFGGYPDVDGKVLYAIHDGGIAGTGSPTNRGPDPYVATRGTSGWSTEYVGIPADGGFSAGPFSSTLAEADKSLGLFAYAGPEICAPCFADGSSGVPLHLPGGNLIQGMKGSIPQLTAKPAGFVGKHFSADGSHFIFGADKKFETVGKEGSVSIYDRNLSTSTTQVVSTLPLTGETMSGVVGQLDVSGDGSRIVVAQGVSAPDGAGNQYWHPYLHIGTDSKTVDLAPGTTSGVLYAGMSSDGSRVVYATRDKLLPADEDTSADLYAAEVGTGGGPATVTLLSSSAPAPASGNVDSCDPVSNADGNNWNAVGGASSNTCGVIPIGGGGGVATGDGSAYFLSPEKLDGSGTMNEPNLFVSRDGAAPEFVATVEPNNSMVRDAVKDTEIRRQGDFQVTQSGRFAVFATSFPLTGYLTGGRLEVFRYDADGLELECASCAPTEARPLFGDATLASGGLSVSDDGRVFFTSTEPLVLLDSNSKKDAYEWNGGDPGLISGGVGSFDSGLLSATADGGDAYFFTRDTLAPQDHNGTVMKIYDARQGGGFFVIPSPQPCAAADECHGPGTQAAPPAGIGSFVGTPDQRATNKCRKGFVKKRGKCVKKRARHRRQGRPNGGRRNG